MDNPTPEEFLVKINIIDVSSNIIANSNDTDEDKSTKYEPLFTDLKSISDNIQTQIDLIVNDKPVKSEQMLKDYTDIYNTTYMTNFCFFLGICLIVWYILKPNSNTPSNVPKNSPTS